ncbi:uncharacterized protein [Argopecten irradians]|uniref:uncharacterized protein isoform X1 n=2 Tax=Argopecten irradians TaxID=31199 RepID=UPI00371ECE1D
MRNRQSRTQDHKISGGKEQGLNSNHRNKRFKQRNVLEPEKYQPHEKNIFPNWSPWILYAVTLVIRVTYINKKSNWWIYHPDEIYQSIEVGFSEASGHGFRTYEYLPPPTNVTTSVEEQEVRNGMYSMRSFMFPLFYTLVFKIATILGYNYNPYLLGRLSHVVITTLLPVSVFKFSRTMYKNPDVAWLAAIFVSFSQILTVLGTHTLVNSFLSPFLFYCLSVIVGFLFDPDLPTEIENSQYSNGFATNGHVTALSEIYESCSKHHISTKTSHQNGYNNISNGSQKLHQNGKIQNGYSSTIPPLGSIQEPLGVEVMSGPLSPFMQLIVSGFVLGVVCYIRIDIALFGLVFAASVSFEILYNNDTSVWKLCTTYLYSGCGYTIGVCLGGFVDKEIYGTWFLSPLQWYRINLKTNISSILFGSSSFDVFIDGIFLQSWYIIVFYSASVIAVCVLVATRTNSVYSPEQRHTFALLVTSLVLFCVYSNVEHKEVRFLHNIIVLMLMTSAVSFHFVIKNVLILPHRKLQSVLYLLVVSYVANAYMTFPSITQMSNPVTTTRMKESAEVNACLEFISRQTQVSGVFVDTSLYKMGGLTIIKHEVPLVILIHNEYHEYHNVTSSFLNKPGIRIVNRFSDFIHSSNIVYVTKQLLQGNTYNYIVTSRIRESSFGNIGFKSVFSFGAFVVLHRTLSTKERKLSQKYATSLSDGDNATVLEYEASWLYTAGLYSKSIHRAESALQLNDQRIRPFQIIGSSYVKMNQWEDARKTEQRCVQRHGKAKCREPQSRIVLHEEYIAFDEANSH